MMTDASTDAGPANEKDAATKLIKTKSPRKSSGAKAASALGKRADDAAKATTEALSSSPLAALAGAIAVGAVAAALIPATKRELAAVGPLGDRVRDAMGEAIKAARDAGNGELTAAGISFTAATTGLSGVLASLVKAATVSAVAAGTSMSESGKAAAGKPTKMKD